MVDRPDVVHDTEGGSDRSEAALTAQRSSCDTATSWQGPNYRLHSVDQIALDQCGHQLALGVRHDGDVS